MKCRQRNHRGGTSDTIMMIRKTMFVFPVSVAGKLGNNGVVERSVMHTTRKRSKCGAKDTVGF